MGLRTIGAVGIAPMLGCVSPAYYVLYDEKPSHPCFETVEVFEEYETPLGVEVMIKTLEPREKLCENVSALLTLRGTDRLTGSCEVVVDEEYRQA